MAHQVLQLKFILKFHVQRLCVLQASQGLWHLQSIEVADKLSGQVDFSPCPQWLHRSSSIKVILQLGQA